MRNQNTALILLLEQRSTGRQRTASEVALRPFVMDMMRNRRSEWESVIREYYARPEVRQGMMNSVAEWRARNPSVRGHVMPSDIREMHVTPWELTQVPPLYDVPVWSIPAEMFDSNDGMTIGLAYVWPLPLVELLLARGLSPGTRHSNGRGVLVMAVRAGRERVADLLRAHGADPTEVQPRDELMGACLRLDAAQARSIVDAHPDLQASLGAADFDLLAVAARSSLDHLSFMLETGVPAGGQGAAGVTALHVAAWHGRLPAVRTLLDHGAPVSARDGIYGSTPLDWAVHGSTHCRTAEEDYRAVFDAISSSCPS
jgi:hypothetical protein